MSFEKTAKQMKGSLNSTSSLYILLSSVADLAKTQKAEGNTTFGTALYALQDTFLGIDGANPSIKNVLNYVTGGGTISKLSPEGVLEKISYIKRYIRGAEKKIASFGAKKLNEKGKVFVFGHDSFLSGILKSARSKGKSFDVYNTEMRPNFYGRKLAGELTKGGINIHHYAVPLWP